MAASTWPGDVRPVVHLSESRREEQGDEKIRPQAHSDIIYNKFFECIFIIFYNFLLFNGTILL